MRDGNYALRISADGFVGSGVFAMRDNRGAVQDTLFNMTGHLIERRAALDAVFNVKMEPAVIGNKGMPKCFSLHMDGAANNDSFHVIGVGPLGLIIEIDGEWAGPTDRRSDLA